MTRSRTEERRLRLRREAIKGGDDVMMRETFIRRMIWMRERAMNKEHLDDLRITPHNPSWWPCEEEKKKGSPFALSSCLDSEDERGRGEEMDVDVE